MSQIGMLIDGRYRLIESLGAGGMSRVYRAEDQGLGREVAIKLLREPLVQHTGRFEREARTMGRLRHPSVVKVYGYGMTRGEEADTLLPYLVLELVEDAVSLIDLLRRRGRLTVDEAVRLMRPVAGALAEAHAHGIVHRDLKPENILIQTAPGLDPLLRLLDFGIAAWDEPTAQRLTQTGQVFGTPAYMAPEHATGEFSAGPTVDVWSLGVMLHELVSGECPFRGPHVTATLFNITNKEPPRLEDVPEAFQALVDDCLVKDPHARLPDAAAVLERLGAMLGEPTVEIPGTRSAFGTDPTVGMQRPSSDVPVEAWPEDGDERGETVSDSADTASAAPLPSEASAADPPPMHSAETMALGRPARRRAWAPMAISALGGLLVGLLIGWSGGDGPAEASVRDRTGVASASAGDGGPPLDAGPAPLVDDALAPAVTFFDAGDAQRALSWLEANPDAGHADSRARLRGLIALARDRVSDGIELLDPLLTRRPDLARDEQVQSALLGLLGDRDAAGLVDMLGVMVEVDPAFEDRVLTLTDHDDYRTRRRAFRVVQQAGRQADAAALKYYVRNLRLIDCDLRKHAVERLRGLGDPAAIGPIKRMDQRTGFFDNLCMDDAVERALGTLYAAERRRARAARSREGADLGPPDSGPRDATAAGGDDPPG